MMDRETQRYWETMVEYGVATNEELGLACALCGTNVETMRRVLYTRTGYRTLEQWEQEVFEEGEEE